MPIGLQRVVRVTGGLCAQVPAETIANRTDFCAKTDRPEAAGSLGELEKCFSSLACFSPRTHLALDLYTAGPLSLDGPPGTVPSIPGLPPLTDVAPARWACRVRRCAFSNMVGTRHIRPLARFCFDAWKMLMYIRLQFDLGKEETVEQTVRNEALLAAYRRKLVEADRQLEALVRQQRIDTAKKQKEGHQDRQVEETERGAGKDGLASRHAALSRLLDETENEVDLAHHHERILSQLMDRVEKLELEKAVLQDHLLQAQIACWQQEQSVQGRGNVRLQANKNRPPSPSSDHQALISLPTRTHSRPPPAPANRYMSAVPEAGRQETPSHTGRPFRQHEEPQDAHEHQVGTERYSSLRAAFAAAAQKAQSMAKPSSRAAASSGPDKFCRAGSEVALLLGAVGGAGWSAAL